MAHSEDHSAPGGAGVQSSRARHLVVGGFVLLGISAVVLHLYVAPPSWNDLAPITTYRFQLDMQVEGYGERLNVRTFLPMTDERQQIGKEHFEHDMLVYTETERPAGREANWSGQGVQGSQRFSYSATITPRGISYELPQELPISKVPAKLARYLLETDAIQVTHAEVEAAWNQIQPADSSATSVIQAIFDFIYRDIETTEFKGTTDALTALRLGQASCNGKSRLFVALARRSGIPARLVGGVILNQGRKKTSHQWVETYLAGHWVPFCPTNGHFASLPENYLVLYRSDEALFTRTVDINFDYRFNVDRTVVSGTGVRMAGSGANGRNSGWTVSLLDGAGLEVSRIFLLFPLAALIIVVFKNVVGLQSFGVFLPMLIAAACRHTGLWLGLGAFLIVTIMAALVSRWMTRLQILQGPRLSVLITAITMAILLGVVLFPDPLGGRLAMLGMFPPVILGFTGERLNGMAAKRSFRELATVIAATSFLIVICYATFGSIVLRTLVVSFPEVLLLVIAAQMGVGRWAGLRLTEYVRFSRAISRAQTQAMSQGPDSILGINARNIEVLGPLNSEALIEIADDKLATKNALEEVGVPVPKTLAVVRDSADLERVVELLTTYNEFVIKPAHGAAGNGVLVIRERCSRFCHAADGNVYGSSDLRRHITEVLAGIHSDGNPDQVLVEELIHPDPLFYELSPDGLSDLRLILVRGVAVAAMLRVPTRESGGRANLHQGAVGVPVSLADGYLGPGFLGRHTVERHPDSSILFSGQKLPGWSRILEIARNTHRAIPLGYVGLDICMDVARGPLVLEVNARPGLEIQNVHGCGLREGIETALLVGGDKPCPAS